MTRQEAEALYERGREPTVEVLLDLSARLDEAEEKLCRNSTNSSSPPSSDPPSVGKSKGEKASMRKRGAQPGHEGKIHELLPEDQVGKIVRCDPAAHCECGGEVEQEEIWHRHQVIELPKVVPDVSEWQIFKGICVQCGRVHYGKLPPGTPTGMLGPRVMAWAALLCGKFHLSRRLVQEILEGLLRMRISLGAVSKNEERVSEALAAPVEEAKAFIQQQAVVHADETGHKEAGKAGWMWVAATAFVSVFIIRFSRAGAVAKELLGEGFKGRLVSDRWSAYAWIAAICRQLCWAHLERDFKKISERRGHSAEIGNAILVYVHEMWHLWHLFKSGKRTRSWFQRKMAPIRQGIERLLAQGKVCGHSKTERTCKRILKLKKALWTFVDQPGVEPTNNLAERILRSYVIWRKMSFGTQSERGRLFVERIMTVSATCKLQGRNVFEYVTEAIIAHLNGQVAPPLLPQDALDSLAKAA